tara:strand:+ start:353 stop:1051 length:699 start_codon:yes stop_codon:yes gene_type:complete
MKIYLSCYKCDDRRKYPSTVLDNGIYQLVCDSGHKVSICVQQTKFEQFYEISLNALIDGCYRDAVVSVNAAIERLYEFYIKFVMEKNNSFDVFGDAWKRVSSQSERQLGAYVFLYSLENNRLPPLLSTSMVTFRNNIVHKGEFPTLDKTIEFCKSATDVIIPVLKEMKSEWDVYRVVFNRDMSEKYEGQPLSDNVQLVSSVSYLALIEHGSNFDNVRDSVADMRTIYSKQLW